MTLKYKQIAVSTLLNCGYSLFVPVDKTNLDYDYLLEHNQVLSRIKVIPTYINNRYVNARLVFGKPPRLLPTIIDYICIVRESTKQVWLIPTDVVQQCTTISLEQRYDDYLLSEEVLSISKNSIFTQTAKQCITKGEQQCTK